MRERNHLVVSWIREVLLTPQCVGCNKLGSSPCVACQLDLVPFDIEVNPDLIISCASIYDGWLRDVLIEFKNGKGFLARPLAELLTLAIPHNAVIVPMPTTQAKIRSRGFDTIGLLAKELSRIEPRRHIMSALVFKRRVRDQVGLGERDRRLNVLNSMVATRQLPREIVVIDDVLTTGATIIEAARAASIAGANTVSAAVLCGSPLKRYR